MGKVDRARHAEDERESRRDQEEDHRVGQATQELEKERIHEQKAITWPPPASDAPRPRMEGPSRQERIPTPS